MKRVLLISVLTALLSASVLADNKSGHSQKNPVSKQAMLKRLDLNRASVEQLTSLKGIGKKKAQAIVRYRQKNGSFKTVDELVKVKGIGKKALMKLKPLVKV